MNKKIIEEKYVLEYIKDMINDYRIKSVEVNNAKYHHNTSYKNVPIILKYGILSLNELNRLGLRNDTTEFLKKMSVEESHINGIDGISLSVVGLTDLYSNEEEYDPYIPGVADFIISSDLTPMSRFNYHYGNEFVYKKVIPVEKIKSLDVRILKLLDKQKDLSNIKKVIDNYNALKEIALIMKELQVDMPLREMSEDNLTIDIDKMANTPRLILK